MKRIAINILLLLVLAVLPALAAEGDLRERLAALEGVSGIERLESDHYAEKYLIRVTQRVDPKDPAAGTFTQRVIVGHAGYDRPTVIVTEGYGAAYALNSRYREELTDLLDANLVFVEHRYFLESTPEPCDWDYLTAENSAYDLHRVRDLFRALYPGKWLSTGISKGGQTAMIYRAFFPDDVDASVPYVAPLCRAVEDGRHEPFLRKVGTRRERKAVEAFQLEILKRKAEMLPLLEAYAERKGLRFRVAMGHVDAADSAPHVGRRDAVRPPRRDQRPRLFRRGPAEHLLLRAGRPRAGLLRLRHAPLPRVPEHRLRPRLPKPPHAAPRAGGQGGVQPRALREGLRFLEGQRPADDFHLWRDRPLERGDGAPFPGEEERARLRPAPLRSSAMRLAPRSTKRGSTCLPE